MFKHHNLCARWQHIVLLLCLASLTLSANATTSAVPTIMVYGDSLSAGYGIAKTASWPHLLQQRLQTAGYPHQVVNLSISGETTQGGLSRLAKALLQQRPTIIILELGANDGLRGLPISQTEHNLARMIAAMQQQKAKVLLVGMRLPPNYGPDYEAAFAALFPKLAKHYHTALLPFLFEGFADQPQAFQADGLHPTAASQLLMLDNLWPQLQPLLPPLPKPGSGKR